MSRWRGWVVGSGSLLSLLGCATLDNQQWFQQARTVTAKAADTAGTAASKAADTATDAASKAIKRMDHYLEEKDLLKTFHDAGEHSETAVLEVLHKSAGGAHKAVPPKAGAGSATPPTVTAPAQKATPAAPATPAQAPSFPAQYAGTFRWPLDAGIVSSGYGARWGKFHKGIDIAADTGEPVYAIASGDVIYAGDGLRGYGNVVIVRHDKRMTSLYAHNSELKVHLGDRVTQGTTLALLGSTGHSTGPHVHFEIREGDAAVNPMTLLPKSKISATADASPHTDPVGGSKVKRLSRANVEGGVPGI